MSRQAMAAARSLLWRPIEAVELRRRLVLLGGHQVAIRTDEIGFPAERDIVVVGPAIVLDPDRIAVAIVAAGDGPRPGIGMIDGGDLVMQKIAIGRVEKNALPDDGLVVGVQGQPAGV